MRRWWPWALAIVLGAATLAAFVIPRFAFEDCRCALTDSQRDRLKSQAAHRIEFPALALQIKDAHAAGNDPDAGLGTVVIRGPFGVKTGEVVLEANAEEFSRSIAIELLLWAAVAALLALAVTATALGLFPSAQAERSWRW